MEKKQPGHAGWRRRRSKGIGGHLPSRADSDPRWSDDLACHVSKSGKKCKDFIFPVLIL